MTLMEYLPEQYQRSAEVRAIQGTLQPEVDALWRRRDGLLDQLDVRKATWGLAFWEKSLGIPPDATKSYDIRRAAIYAKLRARGPTTVAMVRRVVSSYTELDFEIVEHPIDFVFDIKFLGTAYRPETLDGLSEALDEIIPPYVDYDYILIMAAGRLTYNVGFVTRIGRRLQFEVPNRRVQHE